MTTATITRRSRNAEYHLETEVIDNEWCDVLVIRTTGGISEELLKFLKHTDYRKVVIIKKRQED